MTLAKSVGGFFLLFFFCPKRFICLFVSHIRPFFDSLIYFLFGSFFAGWLSQLLFFKEKLNVRPAKVEHM